MNSFKHLSLALAAALIAIIALTACEKIVILDLDGDDNPVPFVEAHVINQPGYSFVRVTQTANFYNSTGGTPVTNAIVTVKDDQGNSESFVHVGSEAEGYYLPVNEDFKGEVGRKYFLEIKLKDQTITSESILPDITPIDSVQTRFMKATPFREEGYYLYYYGTDPPNERNWYRWKVYENDTLYDEPQDILIASDDFIKEKIDNLELPYPFQIGDTVRIEQYGITEPTFLFYQQLQGVIFNDGGLFSPPPANPVTNLKGKAFGIFNTASVTDREVIVRE
ncbi:MAG: DUF4249 domain-containing protein [Cytophagales bacterium]|nr:MAG: DUF4249 domain-containing protein [Cytophagales bacterium]TAF59900.1 MAG: DUF4249 domain-containing protein [Cytophagales bacterium]